MTKAEYILYLLQKRRDDLRRLAVYQNRLNYTKQVKISQLKYSFISELIAEVETVLNIAEDKLP